MADADRIKKVATRVAGTKDKGHRVAVVVSALGQTTDELIALARQVSTEPSKREFDMLLSTGEQVSIALLAMALQELGYDAISFTGLQVGIATDSAHTRARIISVNKNRIMRELDRGKAVIVAGFQGVDENQEITTSEGETIKFDVDPFKKHCLLEGLDDIGLTLEKATAIDSFETQMHQSRPWV